MKLTIDKREQTVPTLNTFSIEPEYRNLDVGDFLFSIDDKPVLVIERKTWADLASAIETGRYKEQKLRLTSYECRYKVYLFEGEIDRWQQHGRINKGALKSAALGTSIRDGFGVVFTKSFDETVDYINLIATKIPSWLEEPQANWAQVTNVKVKKSDNLTPDVCYIHQLSQIPKISDAGANAVAKVYPTMPKLISAYLALPESQRPEMLAKIEAGSRRLGPVASGKIYEFLFQTTVASG
jgi:ERCC4-type nuclease